MDDAIRTFLVIEGEIRKIGHERFLKICSQRMPEFAGQKIPYALLIFELEQGTLSELRHSEGGYLVFDKQGNIDNESLLNHARLIQEGENDPRSFAARRARKMGRENTWNPTRQQLDLMISLAKGNG